MRKTDAADAHQRPTTLLHNKRLVVSVCTLTVMLLVFVPLWWNTTGALRTPIPTERIAALAPKILQSPCLVQSEKQSKILSSSHVMKQSGRQVWNWRQELSLVVPLASLSAGGDGSAAGQKDLSWWHNFVESWEQSALIRDWTRVLCTNCNGSGSSLAANGSTTSTSADNISLLPVVSSQVLFHGSDSSASSSAGDSSEGAATALPTRINSADDISRMLNYNSDTWKFAEIEGILRVLFVLQRVNDHEAVSMYGVRDWGAVVFINSLENVQQSQLTEIMTNVVKWFLEKEPASPAPIDWQQLQVELTQHYATKALESLLRLVELLQKMPDILVGEEVSRLLVVRAVEQLEALSSSASNFCAKDNKNLENSKNAFLMARDALAHAEEAFFHPTMLSLLYFPDSQKLAVYLPLVLPVAVTVLVGLLREIKSVRAKRKAAAERNAKRAARALRLKQLNTAVAQQQQQQS